MTMQPKSMPGLFGYLWILLIFVCVIGPALV
jgi:hypothetical protein